MDYRILGPVEVWDNRRWTPVAAAKQRAFLALLLLHPGRVLDCDWLVETVWNGRPPPSAARLLPHYAWRLRGLLPDGGRRLRTATHGYLLDADVQEIDHGRFSALMQEAAAAVKQADTATALNRIAAGLQLWRGPALADARSLPVLETAAQRFDKLRLDARETLAEVLIASGRPVDAVTELEKLTNDEPFRERPWQLLMLALYRAMRRPEALATFQRMWRRWTSELGTEPGHPVRELHQRILNDDPSLTAEGVADPPPAGSIHIGTDSPTGPARPAQLPADPPYFTGRTAEIEQLVAMRGRIGRRRAVSIGVIHGMAGAGKTALAVHIAHRLARHYPDGQLFIDLHGFTEGVDPVTPAEALDRMLRALGVASDHLSHHLDDRAASWRSTLADKRILIVLDNAANEAQVRPLLPGSPGCLVLVTSRSHLIGLDKTVSLALDVMPLADAHLLFLDSLGRDRVAESPDLVTDVVELCGRLPLAIRIASSRLAAHPTWTIAELADRLRDSRQRLRELTTGPRSVAAAVALSYTQLAPPLQRMYRLLGLHPGADFDQYAAAGLADVPVETAGSLLDDLALVHLVQEHRPGRYRFHDLLRITAAQAAADEESPDTRRAALTRLFDHYGQTATAAMADLYPHEVGLHAQLLPAGTAGQRPDQRPPAPGWLDVELANLLAVARHAATHGWPDQVRRFSLLLDHHLRVRGHLTHADTLHSLALSAARDQQDQQAEVVTLNALGYTHRLLGRPESAEDCFRQALRVARAIGHPAGELEALQGLGHAHRAHGRFDMAVECFEGALTIARDVGHKARELPALQGLGYVCRIQGRLEAALSYFEQALATARQVSHHSGELGARSGLGYVSRALGRLDDAADHFTDALTLARALRHRHAEVGALWGLGQVRYAQRQHDAAGECFAEAIRLAREIDDRNGQFEGTHGLGLARCATGQPDEALVYHKDALGLASELGQPIDRARALHGMAAAYRELGCRQQAEDCWREALSLFESLDVEEVEEVSADDMRAGLAGVSQ